MLIWLISAGLLRKRRASQVTVGPLGSCQVPSRSFVEMDASGDRALRLGQFALQFLH